jgi:RNA polymerase sigma-54 factor
MSGPGFNQDLRQRQTQSLVLAPQLRHSLKILQVAALDLRSVIQEELQSNPTLEELPMEGVSLDNKAPEDGTDGDGTADTGSDAANTSAPTDQTEGEP